MGGWGFPSSSPLLLLLAHSRDYPTPLCFFALGKDQLKSSGKERFFGLVDIVLAQILAGVGQEDDPLSSYHTFPQWHFGSPRLSELTYAPGSWFLGLLGPTMCRVGGEQEACLSFSLAWLLGEEARPCWCGAPTPTAFCSRSTKVSRCLRPRWSSRCTPPTPNEQRPPPCNRRCLVLFEDKCSIWTMRWGKLLYLHTGLPGRVCSLSETSLIFLGVIL